MAYRGSFFLIFLLKNQQVCVVGDREFVFEGVILFVPVWGLAQPV